MEQFDLRTFLVEVLERLGLEYFITGSVAAIFYGEPRFTNDIDVVVRLSEQSVTDFCAQFPAPDFYVSDEAARQAVRSRGQFNIIHPDSGLKIDVIVPADTPYDHSRLSRKQRGRADQSHDAFFASPEDVILKKMQYYQEGGSEKHIRDITGILKLSGSRIDTQYIRGWADRLGLTATWETILKTVTPP
ncbi:MAG TPA: hypothetical protein VGI81_15475 [Tepidisphaeraceae bacterium]|jgi:hypothetical protein